MIAWRDCAPGRNELETASPMSWLAALGTASDYGCRDYPESESKLSTCKIRRGGAAYAQDHFFCKACKKAFSKILDVSRIREGQIQVSEMLDGNKAEQFGHPRFML